MLHSKEKLKKQQRFKVIRNFFVSFIGLTLYFLGSKVFKFPQLFPSLGSDKSFFFLGINSFLNASFFLGIITTFINLAGIQISNEKWKTWRSILNRVFIVVCSAFSLFASEHNFFFSDSVLKTEKFFFLITVLLVHACLLDLLIQFLNNYGICDGFNLIFLVDSVLNIIGVSSFQNNDLGKILLTISVIFGITFVLVSISNIKWSVPVNSLFFPEEGKSSFFKKKDFRLEFKMSLSPMWMHQIKQFFSLIFNVVVMFKTSWSSWSWKISDIFQNWSTASSLCHLMITTKTLTTSVNKPYFLFFILDGGNRIFNLDTLRDLWNQYGKWTVALNIISLVLIRSLFIWLGNVFTRYNADKIAKRMRMDGFYIDGVPYGLETKKVLQKSINKMAFCWIAAQFFLNVIFDNFVTYSSFDSLGFVNFSSCVNVTREITEQTLSKTKYLLNNV